VCVCERERERVREREKHQPFNSPFTHREKDWSSRV